MYLGFSHQLNDLINLYFSITNEGKFSSWQIWVINIVFFVWLEDMEVQVAGSEEERNALMPTCYVDTHRDKAELESEIRKILNGYHHGMAA